VGRHIIPALKEQLPQAEIYVIDKDTTIVLPQKTASMITQSYKLDITSGDDVDTAFANIKPEVVVHTAGINPPLAERYLRRIEKLVKAVNVGGTANVVSAAQRHGCKAFVYTSSCTAVTDNLHGHFANINESWPVARTSTMYGESKVEAEELVLGADGETMATCVLRPSVIFGEGDEILGTTDSFACRSSSNASRSRLTGASAIDTCLHSQRRDSFPSWRWHEPMGYCLCWERGIRSRSCCQGPADNEIRTRRGYSELQLLYYCARREPYLVSRSVTNLYTQFIQNNEPVSFREFCLAIWQEFGHTPRFQVGCFSA
jgi:sterol-4alpha-carboxylate 3-dehydrogenase (decarboxylating)